MPKPEAVLRQWYDEVWNAHSDDAIAKLMAADALVHGLAATPTKGPDEFRPFHRAFVDAFPDMRIEILRMVTEGDITATYIRATGTHRGAGLGIPATGKSIDMTGMVMARVRDGQIVEGWNVIDFLSMYQQLGLVPNPVGAPAAPKGV